MCFYSDEQAECYSEETRKARKQHKCHGCGETIERGQLYIYGHGVFDGSGFSSKVCGVCRLHQIRIDEYELNVEGCRYPESWPMPEDLPQWLYDHPEFVRSSVADGQERLSRPRSL